MVFTFVPTMSLRDDSPHAHHRARESPWYGLLLLLLVLFHGVASSAGADEEPKKADAVQSEKTKDADAEIVLLKYPDMVLPSAEELLRAKPFDWIVLKSMDVLVVEPVGPRPDTLAILNSEYERLLKGRAGFTDGIDRLKERRRQLQRIPLTLADPGPDQDPDYVLETKLVQKIDYYEDLILRRANLLIDAGNISLAYDLLLFVDRRHRENNVRLTENYQANKQDVFGIPFPSLHRSNSTKAGPDSTKRSKNFCSPMPRSVRLEAITNRHFDY
jgi:hypothetical protein